MGFTLLHLASRLEEIEDKRSLLVADIKKYITRTLWDSAGKLDIKLADCDYSINISLPSFKKNWTTIDIVFFNAFTLSIIDGMVSTSVEDGADDFLHYARFFYPIADEVNKQIKASL
jgi:hypothetical protein